MNDQDKKKLAEQIARLQEIEAAERIQFPFLNSKDMPITRVDNTKALLAHYDITVKYNEMTKDVEIDIPDTEFHSDTEMNAMIIEIQDRARHHGLPPGKSIDEHLQLIANQNVYHPVRDWIESAKWDGQSRLDELNATIETDHPMNRMVR